LGVNDLHKLSRQLAVLIISSSIVIHGTTFSVCAADAPPLSSNTPPASSNTPQPNSITSPLNSTAAPFNAGQPSAPNQISSSQPSTLNLQQLPSIIDIPQTPESIEKVLKLEEEGDNLFKQRLLDKAMVKWQECYGLSLEMKYAEGEGRALTNMGRVFIERGQFVKAKYMGENAIEVLNGVSDKKALGRAHLYLAQAYFGLDNPLWAGEQLEQAMKAFQSDNGNNAGDTAKIMAIAANVLLKMGKLKEALQFLQASALYSGQAGDNTASISSRIQVVDVLLALGLSTAASEEAEKALSVARTAPDQLANLSAALSCMANCKISMGEYSAARKLYEQVLGYCKSIPKEQLNNLARANIYLGYGTALSALHRYEQAKQVLEIALPVFKSAGASLPQAQASNALGIVELELGHEARAKELLDQALDLHNLIVPKQDVFRIMVLHNLGCLEARLGQNTQARAHFTSCAEHLKKAKEPTLLGRTDVCLAEISLKLADSAEAERLLNEAIKNSDATKDDAALWREYTLLARIQLAQNNIKAANESLLSAVSFFRSPQAGAFPSPELIEYPSRRNEEAYQLVYLLVQQKFINEALLASDQIKQETFLEDWHSRDVQMRSADNELYNDLVTQRAHLHSAEVSSPPDKIVKEWQNWLGRFRTLTTQNKSLARLIAPLPVVLADVAHAANTNNCLILDYLQGHESTVIFVIDGAGRVTGLSWAHGGNQVNSQVNSLLATMTHSGNSADADLRTRLLHNLYEELLPSSVQSLLSPDEKQSLAIVPYGALSNLPFAALIDKREKFLVNSHPIIYSTSLAAMLDCPPRYVDENNFLFASSDSQPEDLTMISSTLPSSAVSYLNGAAEIKNLADQAKGKAAVHVANKFETDPDAIESVLAGCQSSCDLLVLSGLEAGKCSNKDYGKMFPIDNIAQRCQAFGARNVLISLWRRPLSDTKTLWQEFYNGIVAGSNPASALRNAQQAMIIHGATPADWAQLQIFGPGY